MEEEVYADVLTPKLMQHANESQGCMQIRTQMHV